MNPTAKILTAGLLGMQAQAASDAFAAHKMALETILEPENGRAYHHEAPLHHEGRRDYIVGHEVPVHHQSRAYEHEYRHHYDNEEPTADNYTVYDTHSIPNS